MDAEKTFGKLGYIQTVKNDDYIIYTKEIDSGSDTKSVEFCSQLENVTVCYGSELNTPGIDMGLFHAITVQLVELGWYCPQQCCCTDSHQDTRSHENPLSISHNHTAHSTKNKACNLQPHE